MSGSPNTVKRLPAPVFFSSSPISRSTFIRTISTGMRPSLRIAATLAKPVIAGVDGDAVLLGHAGDLGSKAKPRMARRSMLSALIASRAAFLTNEALTVPYCGPMAIPTRGASSSTLGSRSPTAWMYWPA